MLGIEAFNYVGPAIVPAVNALARRIRNGRRDEGTSIDNRAPDAASELPQNPNYHRGNGYAAYDSPSEEVQLLDPSPPVANGIFAAYPSNANRDEQLPNAGIWDEAAPTQYRQQQVDLAYQQNHADFQNYGAEDVQPQNFRLPDTPVERWVAETYTTGQRAYPGTLPPPPSSYLSSPSWQHQNHRIPNPGQIQAQSTRTRSNSNQSSSSRRSYRCRHPGCRYSSSSSNDLRHHRRYHTPMEERPHPCPNCTRRFTTPREVERHQSTHGLGARYYCPYAGCRYSVRGFGRQDNLDRHLRQVHSNQ